jgi:hypothetical protein
VTGFYTFYEFILSIQNNCLPVSSYNDKRPERDYKEIRLDPERNISVNLKRNIQLQIKDRNNMELKNADF